MNVYDVQLVSAHKNVSIVAILVIYSSVLTVVDVMIVLVVPISETNHIIFSMNHSRKKSTKKESKNTKNHQKKSKHQYENE